MPSARKPPTAAPADLWDMSRIADELGFPYRRVEKWRRGRVRNFPDPLPLDHPRHPDGRRPWWTSTSIRQWAVHAGHMNYDGTLTVPSPEVPIRPVAGMTYDELVNDRTETWGMPEIARRLGVEDQTVRKWRHNFIANPNPHPNRLPAPDFSGEPPLSNADPRVRARRLRVGRGKPEWWAGTIRQWAMQTDRMDLEGNPQRAKSPGAPRTTTRAA